MTTIYTCANCAKKDCNFNGTMMGEETGCEHAKQQNMINALIPKALKIAHRKMRFLKKQSKLVKLANGEVYTHYYFVEYYHKAMNKLAREAGLRVGC